MPPPDPDSPEDSPVPAPAPEAEAAFERLCRLAARLLSAPVALLSLTEGGGQRVHGVVAPSSARTGLREAPLPLCPSLRAGEMLVVDDARGEAGVGVPGVAACLAAPLVTASGELAGALWVMDARPRPWAAEEMEDLRGLAATAVTELELRAQARRLAETEGRLREGTERGNCLLWSATVVDREGALYWDTSLANRGAAQEFLGVTPREGQPLSHAWIERVPPEDRRRIDGTSTEALRSGAVGYRQEYRFQRDDGEIRWLEESARIDRLGPGRWRVVGLSTDVTERKQAEEWSRALQRLGQALNQVTTPEEAARAVLQVADELLGWDACWAELVTPDLERGRPVVRIDLVDGQRANVPEANSPERVSPLARQAFAAGAQLILRTPETMPAPAQMGCPYGDTSRPSASMMCVPIRSGARPVGAMSIQSYSFQAYSPGDLELLQALADYCASALERTVAQEALRESEEQLRFLIEATGQVACLCDYETGETVFRGPCESVLGYPAEAAAPSPEIWAERIHPEDREFVLASFRQAAAGKGDAWSAEYRWQRGDGEYVTLLSQVHFVRGADGQPRRSTSVLLDVTHHRRLEEQLRQAQKMEAIGRLAGGVAHDFNNMLSVINGYADLLLGQPGLDVATRGSLQEVRKAGERAANLTGQLLAFSRKSMVTLRVLDLNELIGGMEKMLRRLIGEDIDFRTDLAPDAGSVRADRGQVEQLVLNLVVNARDAMREGGRLLIRTRGRTVDAPTARGRVGMEPGEFVELTVSDTGHGMDRHTLAHIWEPFFSTKGDLGTGLGLSTVYGIVRQSGGSVTVESRPGKGSTFRILLPHAGGEQEDAAAEAGPQPQGAGTVLVVEDEEMVRKLVRNVLEASGYTVLEAAEGREAVALAGEHPGPIDVLLTDIVMPGGMSGRQVAERLRELRPALKVLYMSGYTDDAVVRHGIENQGAAFLQKPFTPAGLALKLRDLLA